MKPETKKSKNEAYQALSVPNRKVSELRSNFVNSGKIQDLKKLNNRFTYFFLILLISFGAGYAGAVLQYRHQNLITTQVKEIVSPVGSQLVSVIANTVSPSVVSVNSISTTQVTNVFGFSQPSQQESSGTGIIVSSSGYVITNRHVVPAGATSVSLTMSNGTVLNNISVIGETNQGDSLDIAVLKINNPPTNLHPALLGDSNKIAIGDSVVAIGNALGEFQNTVTSGIISGRGRSIRAGDNSGSILSTNTETLQDMIQTDAAINSGNSGGPLIDNSGRVIGVNTAVASNGAQNIGFSIPINDVKGIIKGVLDTGKFERPYLGVYYISITPEVAKQYNLNIESGAYVPTSAQNQNQSPIVANSPASRAGLREGDVIELVNGTVINQNNSLVSIIDQNQAGKQLNLGVLRDGILENIPITVGSE
ncbi:MAG TPA: trypsin-like peptidase domain-containing protein [Candidatus Dormibacteraeota bacterium]|nr:trypsin-like peptidase domain-containing protein [Candidatus Dormibacteraeota bacterium]